MLISLATLKVPLASISKATPTAFLNLNICIPASPICMLSVPVLERALCTVLESCNFISPKKVVLVFENVAASVPDGLIVNVASDGCQIAVLPLKSIDCPATEPDVPAICNGALGVTPIPILPVKFELLPLIVIGAFVSDSSPFHIATLLAVPVPERTLVLSIFCQASVA